MAENNFVGFNDDVYGVLIISSSESKSKDLIKQILGTDDLPEAKRFHEKVLGYPWSIETKYYVADIYLFTLLEKDLINNEFAESVQGVVLYFDSGESRGFAWAKSWLPFVEHYEAEVLIVVCDNCSENSVISKHTVLDWCLKNHFELVELCPVEENEDDDFKETTGCKRIVQAIHAHTWPNLTMKERVDTLANRLERLQANFAENHQDFGEDHILANGLERLQANLAENHQDLAEDQIQPYHILGSEDDDDQFGNLLSSLHIMKERAECLNGNDRKKYAEQVAVAFWRAMGGDEDEIAGLSSEETDEVNHDDPNVT